MKKKIRAFSSLGAITVAATAAVTAVPAQAEAGDWLLRARAINVMPTEESSAIKPSFPTEEVKVDNSLMPEVDATYMVTDNIGLELIAATTKHSASGKTGVTGGIGKLASTWVLPPTLTAQYHFAPNAPIIRPYIGAGINYTLFYNEKASSGLEAAVGDTKVSMDDSFGYALQLGADFPLSEKVFLNLDLKYIDIDTTATLKPTLAPTQKVDISLDPIVVGIGLGIRL